MGLKTKNYTVKAMKTVLPEAYAVIRQTSVVGNKGRAIFAVHINRELASDMQVKPFEEVTITFDINRNENDRVTAYNVAKGERLEDQYNENTGVFEKALVKMPFYGWKDDIV